MFLVYEGFISPSIGFRVSGWGFGFRGFSSGFRVLEVLALRS